MYRQGDVLIVPIKAFRRNWPVGREAGRVVLAHGEVTGHAHAIKDQNAALFRDPKHDPSAPWQLSSHPSAGIQPGGHSQGRGLTP